MALFNYNFYSRAMFQMNFEPCILCNMSSFIKLFKTISELYFLLLKFSSLCFVYILKDLFKNIYVVYFVKNKNSLFMLFYEIPCVPFYSINFCPVK